MLSLADAKAALNITSATSDAELQTVIDAAEAALLQKVGPLTATSTTSRVDGRTYTLCLPVTPVISLTSVTPVGGSALPLGDLEVTTGGVVQYPTYPVMFTAWRYDVVYQAGWVPLPKDLLEATRRLVAHMWQPQRGPASRPGAGPSDAMANTLPGAAYTFPFRVEQLIEPYLQVSF